MRTVLAIVVKCTTVAYLAAQHTTQQRVQLRDNNIYAVANISQNSKIFKIKLAFLRGQQIIQQKLLKN
jgi:hypothetical protein